jgi:hypothetical protein
MSIIIPYIIYPILVYMEFDLKNKIIDNVVNYNYNETIFYKNQFEKTIENGGYIQITYPSKSNTPNIVSDNLFDGEYITKKMYIIKKIHKIKGVDFDGELIIEHTSLTNNETPLFSCFLLKTKNSETTEIDSLINSDLDITINMNDYITSKEAIYYKTNTANVLIFTNPILVISKFDNLKSPKIINPIPINDYTTVKINKFLGNVEGFKEGLVDDQNYVDVATYCQPIDEEDPTIGITADVIIPSDGKVSINKSTTSQITTVLNFFAFFILVLFVAIVVPVMYKYFIIDLVLDNENFTPQQYLNRLSAIDIYISLLLFGFSFSLINLGIVNNKPIDTIIGFYVFIFFISSFIVLKYKRTFEIDNFINLLFPNRDVDKVLLMNNIKPDIMGLFMDNISQLFIKKENGQYKIQFNFIIVIGIFLAFYFILKTYGMEQMNGSSFLTSVPFYMFLLSIYIAVYIKYIYDNNEKNKSIISTPAETAL